MRCIWGNACASIHIHSFYGFVCLICLPSFSNVSGIHIGPLPVSGLVHFWLFWPQSERQTDGRTSIQVRQSSQEACGNDALNLLFLCFYYFLQMQSKMMPVCWRWSRSICCGHDDDDGADCSTKSTLLSNSSHGHIWWIVMKSFVVSLLKIDFIREWVVTSLT